MVEIFGQLIRPDDVSVVVQHHGPLVAVHPLSRGVGRVEYQLSVLFGQGIGDGTAGVKPLRIGRSVLIAGVDEQSQKQDDEGGHGEDVPADDPREGLHLTASRASL